MRIERFTKADVKNNTSTRSMWEGMLAAPDAEDENDAVKVYVWMN